MIVARAFVVAGALCSFGCEDKGASCKAVTKTIDDVAALHDVDLEGRDFEALAKRARDAADRADKVDRDLGAITVKGAALSSAVADYRAMDRDAAKALRALADRADEVAKAVARLGPVAETFSVVTKLDARCASATADADCARLKTALAAAPRDGFDTKKGEHGVGFTRGVLTIRSVKQDADDLAVFAGELAKSPPKDAALRADLERVAGETKTANDVVTTLSSLVLPVQGAWASADAAVAKETTARARIDISCH